MISTFLSIISGLVGAISGLFGWLRDGRMVSLGRAQQQVADLTNARKQEAQDIAARDAAFTKFDTAARAGGLPNDAKLRD